LKGATNGHEDESAGLEPIVAIACDHGGFALKEDPESCVPNVKWLDLGRNSADSVDYPDFAGKLANAIKAGKARRRILICGSGIGISIAANRHAHIRCALAHDVTGARLCRQFRRRGLTEVECRSVQTRTMARIVEIGPKTDLGRLYPDDLAGILAVESKLQRPWPFGVDIDGRIIFDIDQCRVLANFDLHIPKKRWTKESLIVPPVQRCLGDLIFSQETIEIKSFSLPLRVRSDELRRQDLTRDSDSRPVRPDRAA
jgi:ribose 5-phosphate isomerase B